MSSFIIYSNVTSNKQNLSSLLLKFTPSLRIKHLSVSQMLYVGRKHLLNRKKKGNNKKLTIILSNNLTQNKKELPNLQRVKKRKHMCDLLIKTTLLESLLPNMKK